MGNADDVKEILNYDTADVNGTVCGTTALSLSLYKDKSLIFQLILYHAKAREKLDLNKLSKDEKARVEPPLVTACRLGARPAIRMLIKCGADLEGMDNFNHTPLWMATRRRYTDIVHLLINSGANVNPSQIWTHSPLFFAVKYSSKRTNIAKLLVKHGASVHIKKGGSLLYCAIIQGVVTVAKMIVEAGYQTSMDDKVRLEFMKGSLTRNKHLIGWLDEELHQPISLQRQCRTAIRDRIMYVSQGRNFLKFLCGLPFPKGVLAYLALEDDIELEQTFLGLETEL